MRKTYNALFVALEIGVGDELLDGWRVGSRRVSRGHRNNGTVLTVEEPLEESGLRELGFKHGR